MLYKKRFRFDQIEGITDEKLDNMNHVWNFFYILAENIGQEENAA